MINNAEGLDELMTPLLPVLISSSGVFGVQQGGGATQRASKQESMRAGEQASKYASKQEN